ncbi:replicative DNA helicase [Pantoea anthophila]|uniref:replicative DNA helicase n=1 Tax=Pantoea anthophila TaxID=470931 RepID=UPI002DB955D2|nr:replicative DNA helicase [Pantoea anthophila]MEB5707401.1 replicative DNA helicase [Pantoea anthophila]MEB6518272.1 replicative DNA helicase [Pantoea anthophila]
MNQVNKYADMYVEQSVLGSVMLASSVEELQDSAMDAIENLMAEDFTSASHRLVINAIKRLHSTGAKIDLLTLSAELEQTGEIQMAGGFSYLAEITKNTPSARNLPAYTAKLKELALGRRVQSALTAGMSKLQEPGLVPLADIIGGIQSDIGAIETQQESGTRHIMDGINISINEIESIINGDIWKHRTQLGMQTIDEAFGGFNNTDFIVVGGRPGMGKTMFSTTVTECVALHSKKPVLFFSLEMPIEQISQRIAYHRARISKEQLINEDNKSVCDAAWAKLSNALGEFQQAPIHINDKTSLSVHQIRAEARRVHKQTGGLGVIIVDYLQKMKMTNPENMNQSVGEIATGLKNLAKELRCPVIALAQLNRNLEQRANKRPVNADLRESGVIEQEADVIFMVYRDEKYNPQTEMKGVTEIICTKSRHVPGAEKAYYFSSALSGLDPLDIRAIRQESYEHELEC